MCARSSVATTDTGAPLHERSRAIRALRAAIVRSNVPPIAWGYAGAYRLVTDLALARLRWRFGPDLAAVYLRGSTVMDFRVPALSDVDLTIVLRDEVTPGRHEEIVTFWRALSARIPLLEEHPWTLRVEELCRLGRENPGVRYRVLESRRSWALAYGRDVLAGLDAYPPAERLQALVDDLETRLTYLNGLLFVPRPEDALELRRLEYLLYKLVLDLARILGPPDGGSLPGRAEVRRAFLDGRLAVEGVLGRGDDADLRELVRHTARRRLRRTWLADHAAATRLAGSLIDLTLLALRRCYDDPGLLALPGVRDQHAHFYRDDRFLPTGRPFVRIAALPDDFVVFRRELTARRAGGADTVLERDGLRVNLGNVEPALGNCTVVPLPERAGGADDQ